MNLLLPSIEILALTNSLELIELAGRTCYKSEEKITYNSAGKFVEMILKNGHESVLEHSVITYRVICSRGCCYDDQTEVLTLEGWKLFRDIKNTDIFLTLNPKTKKAEYQKKNKYIEEDWSGELIYGQSSMVDFAVTPNHRMLYFYFDSKANKDWYVKKAEEIYNKRIKFKRGLFKSWEGKEVKEVYPQQNNLNFAKFLGIFITDGSFWKSESTGGRIIIYQIKESGREWVRKLLKSLGWRYTENSHNFVIYNTKLYHYLATLFPVKKRKEFSRVPIWIKLAPKEYIEAFLEGVIVGDGNVHKIANHTVIYTANYKLAGDYQDLILKIGYCATIRIDDRRGLKRKLGATVIENKQIGYIVSITKKTNDHLFNKVHWSKKEYQGKVYCITVPNGLIYVRRNGKAFWSGNSHEWVRSRIGCSYSQESTRFVDYKRKGECSFIIPDDLMEYIEPGRYDDRNSVEKPVEASHWFCRMLDYEHNYNTARTLGRSAQMARGLLPIDTKTELVCTMNFRSLRYFLKLRMSPKAHPEIRKLALKLCGLIEEKFPILVEDLENLYV